MIANASKVFSTEYIVFLIISAVLVALLLFLSKKFFMKKLDLEIRILAIIWLLLGIGNRISEVYVHIYTLKEAFYSWKMLIPFSMCSIISIVFPIALLINKGNGKSLHFLVYIALFGSISTLVYPKWISLRPSFWNVEVLFGLIHHVMMLFMCLFLIITKKFKPETKNYYVFFLGYSIMILYGLFLYTSIFNYTDKINITNINKPFFDKLPHLTSWWGLMLCLGAGLLIFLFIYEKVKYKTTTKDFLKKILNLKVK